MTSQPSPAIKLYGHPSCPMVAPVRMMFDQAGVAYTYINIHADDAARQTVREINGGHEGVPVIVFADGHTMTEPGMGQLRQRMQQDGYHVSALTTGLAQLWNYRFVLAAFLLIAVLLVLDSVL